MLFVNTLEGGSTPDKVGRGGASAGPFLGRGGAGLPKFGITSGVTRSYFTFTGVRGGGYQKLVSLHRGHTSIGDMGK